MFGNTGITQNHNVNISGGSEKTKYMLSYNYTGEDGIMDKHGYQKNSIRAKLIMNYGKVCVLTFLPVYK